MEASHLDSPHKMIVYKTTPFTLHKILAKTAATHFKFLHSRLRCSPLRCSTSILLLPFINGSSLYFLLLPFYFQTVRLFDTVRLLGFCWYSSCHDWFRICVYFSRYICHSFLYTRGDQSLPLQCHVSHSQLATDTNLTVPSAVQYLRPQFIIRGTETRLGVHQFGSPAFMYNYAITCFLVFRKESFFSRSQAPNRMRPTCSFS